MDGGRKVKKVADGGIAASSLRTVEKSCVQTRVVEKASGVSGEGLSPRPLNGQRQGSAGGGAVLGMEKRDTVTSEVGGVEIEKIHESQSVELRQVKIESRGGNIHTHNNIHAHTVSSLLPDGEDLLNTERDQLKPEESVENIFHDIAQVGSSTSSLPVNLLPGRVDQEGFSNFRSHQHLTVKHFVNRSRVHDMAQLESNGGQDLEDNQVNDTDQGEKNGQNSTIEKACMNSNGKDQDLKFEKNLNSTMTADVTQSKANVAHEVEVTEADMDSLYGERQDMEVERDFIQEAMQPESYELVPQLRYELPQKSEGTFSVSDLVWGKVKSHPWWPGQIFDFMAASEKAMKHHKKDCFLVAYFGDRTFAWNEVSSLKPFQSYFSEAEKQCTSESFHKAVNCVLEEVTRRVELGLSCSCIPKNVYEKIRFQIVENAGICRESSKVEGVDESASASSFESDKLLKYVKALARFPSGGSNKLELVIAKAHLMSFFRLKGYCSLSEFQFFGELLESKTDNSHSGDKSCPGEITEQAISIGKDDKKTGPEVEELKSSSSHKRKHNLREGAYAKMKERSLSELMGGETGLLEDNDWLDVKASPSSGKRRNGAEYQAAELATQDGRKAVFRSAVSNTTPVPKPSFKIGECIQRAASQLSGSTIVKSSTDRPPVQGSDVLSQSSDDTLRGVNNTTKYSSLDELLSQLRLAAEEPLKEYNSLSTIVNFFSDFRNSIVVGQKSEMVLSVVDKVGGKRRKSSSVPGLPQTFEFDDMNDTYWTDMVVQNGGEEQAPQKRRPKYQPVVLEQPVKPPQVGRRPYTRKKFSQGSQDLPPEKPVGYVDENAPAELVMSFSEVSSIPSETNLNKMFKRFGPLKEYETEVDRESSRARVVFKRCSDAEVACNSAGKFNIFGQITVSYQLNYTPSQLNYTPSITFGASTSAAAPDQEVQLVFPSHDHEMHLDLSTHDQMQLDLSTHDQMQLDLSAHDHMQLDLSTHDEMQLDLSTFEVNLV
ncbi:PWWP domain-containing protein 5-like [Argentina anserina]|uniref:PWWP domain-containing protein 5-like n=1 Tax=Argentina anserina TaxID=57926 RepID=UPI0021766C8A|nr:PWWP domain-containing protein 5-like [Potentilla anserina]